MPCRIAYSRDWAVRAVHEAQMHEQNCFVTLTYAPKHRPGDGSLEKFAGTRFMKSLRYHTKAKLSYMFVGEYGAGGPGHHPHYHALVFGWDDDEKEKWQTRGGSTIYVSDVLKKAWPEGFSSLGEVTFQSAAYVARYVTKKQTGKKASAYYGGLTPEFMRMSLKPAIGKRWLEAFYKDVYPHDYVVMNGKKFPPPEQYDKWLEEIDPDLHSDVMAARREDERDPMDWTTREELACVEENVKARLRLQQRPVH